MYLQNLKFPNPAAAIFRVPTSHEAVHDFTRQILIWINLLQDQRNVNISIMSRTLTVYLCLHNKCCHTESKIFYFTCQICLRKKKIRSTTAGVIKILITINLMFYKALRYYYTLKYFQSFCKLGPIQLKN